MQGGDARVIDDLTRLPQAKRSLQVTSETSGFVSAIECEQIGTACVLLGGGRERKEDTVDPAVGIILHKKVGDQVAAGDALATIHYNAENRLAGARELIAASCQIGDAPPAVRRPLIHKVIGNSGGKR